MPLFKSSRTTTADPVAPAPVDDVPTRKGSIFSSRRQAVSPTTTSSTRSNRYSTDGVSPARTGRGGFFSRRRSSSSIGSDLSDRRRNGAAVGATGATAGTGFFGNKFRDPTIDAARGKVHAAELAEKEAVSASFIVYKVSDSDLCSIG